MAADIGLGVTIGIESATPGTYTTLGAVFAISEPSASMDTIDVTEMSHTDGARRFIGGLIDEGEATFSVHYDPEQTSYTTLRTQFLTRAAKNYKITHVGGATRVFSALITGVSKETPLDDKMTCEFTLKVSGLVTEAVS